MAKKRLIFNIYDRKLYDLDMKAILKLDKYIVDNNIDYDYFDKHFCCKCNRYYQFNY